MIVQFLAELVGTFVYVGAHHISYSNPWFTGIVIAISMYFLNPLIGEVGASLNPIASMVDYGNGEMSGGMAIGMMIAQILAGFAIIQFMKPISALKHFPLLLTK